MDKVSIVRPFLLTRFEGHQEMSLFLLTGRTVRRHQRQPVETVNVYHANAEALQGHQRTDVVPQQLYGGQSLTIIPETSGR